MDDIAGVSRGSLRQLKWGFRLRLGWIVGARQGEVAEGGGHCHAFVFIGCRDGGGRLEVAEVVVDVAGRKLPLWSGWRRCGANGDAQTSSKACGGYAMFVWVARRLRIGCGGGCAEDVPVSS